MKHSLIVVLLSASFLAGCASTVSPDQAAAALSQQHPDAVMLYVDAASNEIANMMMVATLKMISSSSSESLSQLLQNSHQKAVAVAGKSSTVLAATVERAIKDATGKIPQGGKLIIVGQPSQFTEVTKLGQTVGLEITFAPPIEAR